MKHLLHTSLEFEDTSRQNLDACKGPSIYYVSTFLDFFGPTYPTMQI